MNNLIEKYKSKIFEDFENIEDYGFLTITFNKSNLDETEISKIIHYVISRYNSRYISQNKWMKRADENKYYITYEVGHHQQNEASLKFQHLHMLIEKMTPEKFYFIKKLFQAYEIEHQENVKIKTKPMPLVTKPAEYYKIDDAGYFQEMNKQPIYYIDDPLIKNKLNRAKTKIHNYFMQLLDYCHRKPKNNPCNGLFQELKANYDFKSTYTSIYECIKKYPDLLNDLFIKKWIVRTEPARKNEQIGNALNGVIDYLLKDQINYSTIYNYTDYLR